MKNTRLLRCILLILFLVGCGKDPQDSPSTESAESYVLTLPPEDHNQGFQGMPFVETPEGYYYMYGNLICFCARGTNDFYPICSKPECSHEDEDCNAWCSGTSFGYYKGALYNYRRIATTDGAQPALDVIKRNLDGTDHQVVATLHGDWLGFFGTLFHRGKLYIPDTSAVSQRNM